ncbi:hypothetical protein [Ramlibacter algicola]|uniref:Uncharacterized protein n=1 Tax=Ramlibacter algicola TaxID=2795217 RepID=A0A934Q1Q6_9BURK|nr:hypothetical protein [Ramlibacter algicola]MBK0392684.1 hypothetical protein [Ramlibacter algicola]
MRLAFADSEVARVEANGDLLRIVFAAAAIEPTLAGGEGGYLLGLALELSGARWQGGAAACFGRLREGSLSDAVTRFTAIELPFDGDGPWRAEFTFHGERLTVDAAHARCVPDAAAVFRASYAC